MSQTAFPEQAGSLKNAILIAGPTASGKTRMALKLAARLDGAIVNADSMQVYDGLRIVTARPDERETASAPHFLYGHADPRQPYSTANWLADIAALAAGGGLRGRRPIIVGGTGLYFTALTEGLSSMPPVPSPVREGWRLRLEREGPEALHRLLSERDPRTAALLKPADGQRIVRALEVLEASGRSIRDWQARREPPLVDAASARKFVIEADRSLLAERISERFDAMVEQGAVEEVRRFAQLGVDPAMPAMKAIGVREMIEFCEGKMPLEQAVSQAKATTRQYAKRQETWFRNQMDAGWTRMKTGSDIIL